MVKGLNSYKTLWTAINCLTSRSSFLEHQEGLKTFKCKPRKNKPCWVIHDSIIQEVRAKLILLPQSQKLTKVLLEEFKVEQQKLKSCKKK